MVGGAYTRNFTKEIDGGTIAGQIMRLLVAADDDNDAARRWRGELFTFSIYAAAAGGLYC